MSHTRYQTGRGTAKAPGYAALRLLLPDEQKADLERQIEAASQKTATWLKDWTTYYLVTKRTTIGTGRVGSAADLPCELVQAPAYTVLYRKFGIVFELPEQASFLAGRPIAGSITFPSAALENQEMATWAVATALNAKVAEQLRLRVPKAVVQGWLTEPGRGIYTTQIWDARIYHPDLVRVQAPMGKPGFGNELLSPERGFGSPGKDLPPMNSNRSLARAKGA
jgi:hypothetical protein